MIYSDKVKQWAKDCGEKAGMINAYRCQSCGNSMVARLRDSGTTPFMQVCDQCDGDAHSCFYRLNDAQNLMAEIGQGYLFIRPSAAEFDVYCAWLRKEMKKVSAKHDIDLSDVSATAVNHAKKHCEDGGLLMVPTSLEGIAKSKKEVTSDE